MKHSEEKELHVASESTVYHVPVLLEETLQMLIQKPNGTYIDATFGGGGHSRAILDRLDKNGRLYSFDQDADAAENAPDDARFTFVASNFRFITNWMAYYGVEKVDGILADLGVSSHHFDTPERGFSFRFGNSVPDMRMNKHSQLSAQTFLQESSQEKLREIFSSYGELSDAARLAELIVRQRALQPIETMAQLVETLEPLLPKIGTQRHRKLSRIFQSLRIEVNDEMGALRDMLDGAGRLLAPKGRLVVLTYHSLEDRMVKEWMKKESLDQSNATQQLIYGSQPGRMKFLTKKAILPSDEEIARNSRASSAQMRVAEMRGGSIKKSK